MTSPQGEERRGQPATPSSQSSTSTLLTLSVTTIADAPFRHKLLLAFPIQYQTMKFLSAVVLGVFASTASAFTPFTPINVVSSPRRHASSSSSSQIQMVAENAKVCLVTGASRGLGAAIALELGKAGQKVVVNYAGSKDKALEVVDAVIAAGGHAIAVQADCKSVSCISRCIAFVQILTYLSQ